jgi:hypothetical protein
MKIRIAVAVDETGEWMSYGWGRKTHDVPDRKLIEEASDGLRENRKVYFITAEIEPPKTEEIQGTVEEGRG